MNTTRQNDAIIVLRRNAGRMILHKFPAGTPASGCLIKRYVAYMAAAAAAAAAASVRLTSS